jgi:pSer/pThr/pTyr-binding forkhead associated (FHA) protein
VARSTAWLVVTSGDHHGTRFRLNENETTIGRGGDNDVVIDDDDVSREHASVRLSGNDWYLTDLDTTNGTLVNEHRISRHKLHSGDRIVIGRTNLAFMPGPEV